MPPCFSSWVAKPPRSLEAVTARAYYPLLPLPRPLPISPLSFRMGGAAAMFTNKPSLRGLAKYELQHCVRVHTGSDDASYG